MSAVYQFCGKYGGWGIFYALTVLVAVSPFILDLPLPQKGITLDELTFTAGLEPGQQEQRKLPDNWRHNISSNLSRGVYQGSFFLDNVPDVLWGVFLPAHRSNVSVTVNGTYIGDGGSFEPVLARNSMYPLLLSIPKGLLHKGRNTIEVRLFAAPAGHGFLDRVHLGPYSALRPAYQLHHHVLQTSTQIITFSMFVLGIVMLVIWLNRCHDVTYGLLAGMAISWAIQNLNMIVSEIPVSLAVWEKIMHLAALWISSFSYLFISAYFSSWAGKKINKFAKANLIYSLMLSVLFITLPMSVFYQVFYLTAMPYQVLLLIYIFVQMCRMSLMTNKITDRLLTAVAIICMVFTIHDAMITTGLIQSHVFYLSGFCGLFTFMFFGWTLLSRFMDATKSLENNNTILSQRILERETELKNIFEKQKKYEQREAMEQERERLMRDIHDGLGGQLVSILSIVEQDKADNEQVASAVRFALDDLRLIVSSLDSSNMNLPSLLGLFRERILSRYEQAGIDIRWEVEPVSTKSDFSEKRALQILRILQEAAANTAKHANASTIYLSLKETEEDDRVVTTIAYADDGKGFQLEGVEMGYGIANMYSRAAKAGIMFSITSYENAGTRITLSF